MKTWIDDEGNMWMSEKIGHHISNTLLGKVEKPKRTKRTKKGKE